MGLSQGGDMLMMPDSPLDHDGLCFVESAGDEGDAGCPVVFDLGADPLGARASLSESSSGENEPGVPVAIGRQLGVAGVERPVIRQPGDLPFRQALLVNLDGVVSLVVWKGPHLAGDGVDAVDAGECAQFFGMQ